MGTAMDGTSKGVMVWWTVLGAISIGNVAAWLAVAAGVARAQSTGGSGGEDAEAQAARRRQLLLAGLFVLGCGFRSFLPRAEAQRICLYDSWISSAFIGRSVATVAELCLVTQWALTLRAAARAAGVTIGVVISYLMVPFIAFAEVCSWYTALTTNFIGSVMEESTWAVTSALLIVGFGLSLPHYRGFRRAFIAGGILLNVAYFTFMCRVDVPMYLSRWRADEARGSHYLSVAEGLPDSQRRRIVTRRWDDWVQEMPWMSLYFSAGVWMSLALVRAPRFAAAAQSRSQPTALSSAQ